MVPFDIHGVSGSVVLVELTSKKHAVEWHRGVIVEPGLVVTHTHFIPSLDLREGLTLRVHLLVCIVLKPDSPDER